MFSVLVDDCSDIRQMVTDFIADKFLHTYDSHVSTFPKNLIAWLENGEVLSAAGWRSKVEDKLFLDIYFDSDLDNYIKLNFPDIVDDAKICEICSLASTTQVSRSVFIELVKTLQSRNYQLALFTATLQLRTFFKRVGLDIVELKPAEAVCLGEAIIDWGRYYETEPVVCALRLDRLKL